MAIKKTKKQKAAQASPVVKVAIVGFGTVGSSVAKVLASSKISGLQLTYVLNRDVARKRVSERAKVVPAGGVWTENFEDILRSDVDVVVELMGGLAPAEGWIRKALSAGKSVVTANKQLIAYRGAALERLAAQHGVHLVYGAA